jgi:ClpP class serine protease
MASDNPNICAVVFLVNSPGGMVFYTDITAQTIKDLQKPSVSVIFNCAASAAMWLISATDYRIATSQMDRIGSIGVKTSVMDLTGLLKDKLGISVFEIYASLSTKKDFQYRELLKDPSNPQPIIDELDQTNAIFQQAIIDNLGISKDSEVFSGDIYGAKQAIQLGLINEINTMEYAIQYAYNLGLASVIKSNFQFIN